MGEIDFTLTEKQAKQLHFVLKHDLIGGLLPRDMVDTIYDIKTMLEKKIDEETDDEH